MKTRIRFTTLDGNPFTFEAGGKRHTIDRVVDADEEMIGTIASALLEQIVLSAECPSVRIHYDRIDRPSPDAAERAALLGG